MNCAIIQQLFYYMFICFQWRRTQVKIKKTFARGARDDIGQICTAAFYGPTTYDVSLGARLLGQFFFILTRKLLKKVTVNTKIVTRL